MNKKYGISRFLDFKRRWKMWKLVEIGKPITIRQKEEREKNSFASRFWMIETNIRYNESKRKLVNFIAECKIEWQNSDKEVNDKEKQGQRGTNRRRESGIKILIIFKRARLYKSAEM